MKLLRLISVLERIAAALEDLAPPKKAAPITTANQEPLGIITADNETTRAYEEEEENKIQSKEEKLMKEYKEYLEWRERNVR